MTLRTSRTAHFAMMFAAGAVVGGSLLGGLPRMAEAALAVQATSAQQARPDRCAGGTEVSAFVCRNTWMAATRYGNR
jgi:hypothetical protein